MSPLRRKAASTELFETIVSVQLIEKVKNFQKAACKNKKTMIYYDSVAPDDRSTGCLIKLVQEKIEKKFDFELEKNKKQ